MAGLWNLHPFPSLVRVPEFPEVALDDVQRSRGPLDNAYPLLGRELWRDTAFSDMETVHRLTMDQKIAFWRAVMQDAQARGIAIVFFTWNIYAYGASGKHGITHDQDDPITQACFRASVRELVRTYPLLAGIGITAGERVSHPETIETRLRLTYGEGVADAMCAARYPPSPRRCPIA